MGISTKWLNTKIESVGWTGNVINSNQVEAKQYWSRARHLSTSRLASRTRVLLLTNFLVLCTATRQLRSTQYLFC